LGRANWRLAVNGQGCFWAYQRANATAGAAFFAFVKHDRVVAFGCQVHRVNDENRLRAGFHAQLATFAKSLVYFNPSLNGHFSASFFEKLGKKWMEISIFHYVAV
jgi:hypothetical protein